MTSHTALHCVKFLLHLLPDTASRKEKWKKQDRRFFLEKSSPFFVVLRGNGALSFDKTAQKSYTTPQMTLFVDPLLL